jgi:hypothetical protein
MNFRLVVLLSSLLALFTACPTLRPLDNKNATQIRGFAPNAIASSTQFLRGSPVDLQGATDLIQQNLARNPKTSPMLARLPANLTSQFGKQPLQAAASRAVLNPQMQAAFASQGIGTSAARGNQCGTSNFTDADSDGIPANVNYVFDCSASSYLGYSATLTGTVSIKDDNDNNASSGYQTKVTDLTFVYVDSVKQYGIGIEINYDTKVSVAANGKYTVSQNFQLVVAEYKSGNLTGLQYTINGTYDYTPQVGNTANTRFAKGTLKFQTNLGFKFVDAQEDYSSEIKVSANALSVDRTQCASDRMVNSGAIQFTDGKNTMTWTITGCGDGNWNYQ